MAAAIAAAAAPAIASILYVAMDALQNLASNPDSPFPHELTLYVLLAAIFVLQMTIWQPVLMWRSKKSVSPAGGTLRPEIHESLGEAWLAPQRERSPAAGAPKMRLAFVAVMLCAGWALLVALSL